MAEGRRTSATNAPFFRGIIFVALVVVAALLWFAVTMMPAALAQERGLATIIAAAFGVFGTFVSAIAGVLLFNFQQNVRAEERRQDEQKARDDARTAQEKDREAAEDAQRLRTYRIASALRAEISISLRRLERQFSPQAAVTYLELSAANLNAAIAADGKLADGMPKGVFLRENFIFENQLSEALDLPEFVIRAIVQYYQSDEYLTLYGERMSSGEFKGVALDRQKKAIRNYAVLGSDSLRCGIEACALLDYYLGTVHREAPLPPADDVDLESPPTTEAAYKDAISRIMANAASEERQTLYRTLVDDTGQNQTDAFDAAVGLAPASIRPSEGDQA